MANFEGLLAYAVEQADNARGALLRFTVSAALAYNEANVTAGNKAGDEVKAALKLALRERGEDRKTADRVVNNAVKMGAPLVAKLADVVEWSDTVAAVVQSILDLLALDGVKNATRLAVWLGLADADKPKTEKGADLAARILAGDGSGSAHMGKPSEAKTDPKPEPDMPQNEAPSPASLDLTALDDDALSMLADMVAAEMQARKARKALVIAA